MKRFLMLPVLIFGGFCASGAYGDYTKNGTYCVIDYSGSDGQCYWCRAGGDTAAGNCKKGYAGCMSTTEKYVNLGSGAGGWQCTMNGFCKSYCDDTQNFWQTFTAAGYDDPDLVGAEVLMERSGCDCNQWQPNTLYVRCAAGYYGTPDRYVYTGCQRCPGLKNAAGDTVYGHSTAGENENITDCWIDGADGPFGDNSGMYDITAPACIYVTD